MFAFPNPVDEVSARLVAGGVVVLALLVFALQAPWLLAVIAAGFVLRVLAGPRLSPLALLMTKVVRPRLPFAERPTPGPPKRFAQAMGAVMATAGAVLALGFGLETAGYVFAGADRRRGDARVGARVLHRLPDLRGAHAARRHPRGDVRGVREHLGAAARHRLTLTGSNRRYAGLRCAGLSLSLCSP